MALNADPLASGRLLATLFQGVEPRLWQDLVEAGALPAEREGPVRSEWECLALDACLRGLVAAGGFGERTAQAVDEFHAAVLAGWAAEEPGQALAPRRERLAARYAEYGRVARDLEAAGAARVSAALGGSAAAHACVPAPPPAELARLLATMHEALVEGAIAALRLPEAGA
jgi:hypothetical protein